MNGRNFRRKKRGHNRETGYRKNILVVIMVLVISAFAGYLTANYFLVPALGIEPDGAGKDVKKKVNIEEKAGAEAENQEVDDETGGEEEDTGYAIQYGSFSTREAAESKVTELEMLGIEADIREKDGAFKVISNMFDSGEAAEREKDTLGVEDVFITQFP